MRDASRAENAAVSSFSSVASQTRMFHQLFRNLFFIKQINLFSYANVILTGFWLYILEKFIFRVPRVLKGLWDFPELGVFFHLA